MSEKIQAAAAMKKKNLASTFREVSCVIVTMDPKKMIAVLKSALKKGLLH
jgi:hypothetical protein